jgi:ABC-type lipoprotein export system ATPase subunit
MNLVREHAETGTAVLLATHDKSILPMVDRVLFMQDGQIIATDNGGDQ